MLSSSFESLSFILSKCDFEYSAFAFKQADSYISPSAVNNYFFNSSLGTNCNKSLKNFDRLVGDEAVLEEFSFLAKQINPLLS